MLLPDKQKLPTKLEILRLLLMLTNEEGNSQCLQKVIRSVEEREGGMEFAFGKGSVTSSWGVNGRAGFRQATFVGSFLALEEHC